MSERVQPILRYPGGKARIAPWIVRHLPPHDTYVEPFFGGGSVFLAKPRARVEVINDLDARVVNLYRVVREHPEALVRAVALTPYALAEYEMSDDVTGDPVEDARRFCVRVWMSHAGKLGSKSGWRNGWAGGPNDQRGSSATPWAKLPIRIAALVDRLTGVMIDCRPAIAVIQDWHSPGTLIYADPPYVLSSRSRSNRLYRHEMSDEQHIELLTVLDAHPGPVALSGYRDPLYDDRLSHWRRIDRAAHSYGAGERSEVLWLNPIAVSRMQQLPLVAHAPQPCEVQP